ncbi:MAG: hypothetical protein KY462_13890 [Actinobacteria bacterium]|nr:hypothetical protein [Actinomycetota bacterium]
MSTILRNIIVTAAAMGTVATVAAAPAHAHAVDDVGSTSYRSTVTRLEPATDAIDVSVGGGDSYLRLVVQPGHTVVIHGYGGRGEDPEPYLRIDPDGSLHINDNSPAASLNEDRYADVAVPDRAESGAEPSWQIIGAEGAYVAEWHDHRIHWMSPEPPPAVQSDPRQRRIVFDWTVPLTVDGEPVVVHGQLEWLPPVPWWVLVVAALAAGGLALVGGRRSGRASVVPVVGASLLALAAALGELLHAESSANLVGIGLPVLAVLGGALALRTTDERSRFAPTLAAIVAVVVWGVSRLPQARLAVQTNLLPPTLTAVLVAAAIGLSVGALAAALDSRPAPADANEPSDA